MPAPQVVRSVLRRTAKWNAMKPRNIQYRCQSAIKPNEASTSSWSTGRVALVSLTAATAAFAIGSTMTEFRPATIEYSSKTKFKVPQYATMAQMQSAIQEIRDLISEETISTDEDDLKVHGYSEWIASNIETLPVAVAYPRSTEEVSKIAKICHKYKIPMIPYSGGTSIEGHFSAPHGGISVDFAFMDKILKFYEDDMDIVVQPAVGWMDMNQEIAKSGLFFPVDPSPTAKFGGMVATNCSGTNAVRYGAMKDWVLNLTVVLADGTIVKTKHRPRKSSAGYNLNSLFVGSEGTLGLVTEITLKLAIIPKEFSVAVVTFPNIREAAATAAAVMRAGVPVAALELLDEVFMSVVNRTSPKEARKWQETPTLFLKFSGTKASIADNIKQVQSICKAHKAGKFEFARDEKEQHELWSARKTALWSILSLRKDGTEIWSTDVAVPFSKLADIIEISKKEISDLGLFAGVVGHLGDGNFHAAIMYDKTDPTEFAAVETCVHNMIGRALTMEGTSTGEHGIGLNKKECLLEEVGPDTLAVMKSLKQALDPQWLMNPGKIFDTPS